MQKISKFSTFVENILEKYRTLKLSFILLVFALPNLHANSYPQDSKVTLHIVNESTERVLKEIESQSEFKFFYKTGEIDLQRKISLNVEEMPIDNTLKMIFTDGTVSFSTVKNQIVLKKNTKSTPSSIKVDSKNVESKIVIQSTVSGIVTDEEGTPILGVSVLEKGTNKGVATDNKGHYSIVASGPSSVLVFSSVGYIQQEVTVGDKRTVNVTMKDDSQMLSDIVVMGYASQSKSDLTGSVSTVSANDIADLPATSVAETLQGRVSGVQVVTSSGEPGATSDIVIRGGGSVNGMPPLFVVDGIRMGTDYSFNNQDIESIEILKDASAAAIYGAQAAGGVVLISTKRGSGVNEKIKVDIHTSYGTRRAINLPTLLNTKQYFTAREAFGTNVSAWGNPDELPNTNWMDELFRTGIDQNYSASLSGRSDNANYFVSGNYFRQDGVRNYNSFERYSLRINSDYRLGKKVTIGETVYLNKNYSDPTGFGGNYWRSVPSMAVKNEDGTWGNAPAGGYYNGRNPVQQAASTHGGTGRHSIEGSLYADYKIVDWLSFRGTFGVTLGSSVNSIFNEAFVTGSDSGPATLSKTFTDQQNYTANFVLNFNKSYGLHDVKALAGYEVYKEDRNVLTGNASEFAVDVTESYFLNTNLASQRITGGVYPDSRLLSQFGRINYAYNKKYLVSATIRRDGSDRFGPANKWGVFPAFSAGWKISEESFFDNLRSTISSLQLRGSYGLLGNIGSIPQYLYEGSFGPQNITALADGTRVQAYGRSLSLPNTNIKWEEVETTDIGLDATFLGNKLGLTLDWYQRLTKDMIYAVPVPLSAGYNGNPVFTNIGELSNKGFEFGVNYRERFGDFGMKVGLTGSYNKNEVVKLAGGADQAINSGTGGAYLSNQIARTVAGQPLSQFFGYIVEGIYATDQEVIDRGIIQTGAGAGDLIYRDVDGNGIITAEDRDFMGNPWPKLSYGLNLAFDYKQFDLSIGFQGAAKFDVYNAAKHYSNYLAGDYNTTPNVFNASFFNGNGLTDAPRLGYTNANGVYVRDPNANYTKISSYYVEDASYLKLRNIQFGWSFSDKILSSLKIKSANIYVMATNLFTLTNYSGSDPEVLGEGITARGIDNNSRYPQTRTMSMGLKLNF